MWDRLETARLFNEMCQKPEFSFIQQEFEQGLKCKYSEDSEHLVRVYSKGEGIEIEINSNLIENISQSTALVESLIKATGETFSKSYYQAKGILPSDSFLDEQNSK